MNISKKMSTQLTTITNRSIPYLKYTYFICYFCYIICYIHYIICCFCYIIFYICYIICHICYIICYVIFDISYVTFAIVYVIFVILYVIFSYFPDYMLYVLYREKQNPPIFARRDLEDSKEVPGSKTSDCGQLVA